MADRRLARRCRMWDHKWKVHYVHDAGYQSSRERHCVRCLAVGTLVTERQRLSPTLQPSGRWEHHTVRPWTGDGYGLLARPAPEVLRTPD